MSDQLGRLQQLTGMLAATDLRMLQIISARGSMQFVAFDRAGFSYHGRVKALAEAAREGGLKF